jgi:ribosomal protein S12
MAESGQDITLVTWRLINNKPVEKGIAVLTYTVLTKELNSAVEKEAISMIENSLQTADLAFPE